MLDTIDHLAIQVDNIAHAVSWYTKMFKTKVVYQDESWALLQFANLNLALVLPQEHPPHFSVLRKNAKQFGQLQEHRDGSTSIYIHDPDDNTIEITEMNKQ